MVAALALASPTFADEPLTLRAWGRDRPLDAADPALDEWWETREAGLEHGFTVTAPYGEGPLWFELAVPGARVQVDRSGDGATLRLPTGERLRYAGLAAWDERGCPLAAWMESSPEGLRLVVDDAHAVGTVTVDPLLSSGWSVESGQQVAELGAAIASAGDVNGDGYEDVLVGAPRYSNGQDQEGRALVYFGSPLGAFTVPGWIGESNQALSSYAETLASAGDVNGDGYDDVIVGSRRYDNGQSNEGRAWVYHGSPTGPSLAPSWTAESDQASAEFATSVSSAGDVNADGYDDVVIGVPKYDGGQTNEGAAFVYLGSPAGLSAAPIAKIEWNVASLEVGSSVASAGDVDGDGDDEVMVGAPFWGPLTGRVAVYPGNPAGVGLVAMAAVDGTVPGGLFGGSLASAGDVNDDGYGDVIVGATGNGQFGYAYVFHGSAGGLAGGAAWIANPQAEFLEAWFGSDVGSAGDFDADGFGDVLVAAVGLEDYAGGVFVFRGSAAGLEAEPTWFARGDQAGAQVGSGAASADIDGDGVSDLLVGQRLFDDAFTAEGRAFVFYGCADPVDSDGDSIGDACDACPGADDLEDLDRDWVADACDLCVGDDRTGDSDADAVCDDEDACLGDDSLGNADRHLGDDVCDDLDACWGDDALGDDDLDGDCDSSWASDLELTVIASAGDVNGDGYEDVIAGSANHTNGELVEGRAWLWLGSASGLSTTASWIAESDHELSYLGTSVSSAGDVDGDGYDDVLVGAPGFDTGRAFLYRGSAAGLSIVPDWVAEGSLVDDLEVGTSVSSAGDVNGDGYDDVLVAGAVTYFGAGRARLYLGSATGLPAAPASTWEVFYDVGRAGDVDGDGYDDAFVGGNLHLGGPGGLAPAAAFFAVAPTFAAAGDVNGDGFDDVAYGRPFDDGGEGAISLFFGGAGGLGPVASQVLESDEPGAFFGSSIASAGDVDGDGFDDLLVGAIRASNGEPDEGRVTLHVGSWLGLLPAWSAEPDLEDALFGAGVGAADVNGDGLDDPLVVGGFGAGQAWVYTCIDAFDADGDGVGDACDACPGADDALDHDADGVPNACDLSLAVVGTVAPGQTITLRTVRAQPSERVYFRGSLGGVGVGPCPPYLGGHCFDLGAPVFTIGSVVADASGTASGPFTVPAGAAVGSSVTFQAFVLRGPGAVDSDLTQAAARIVQP